MDKVIIGKKGFIGVFLALSFVFGFSLFNVSSVSALYTMSLSTSGDIVVNVAPAGNGTAIYEDELNIVTTCTSGYNLAINTTESPELYLNGDSSNNTTYFSAVDGTSALVNSTNRWGYSATSDSASDVFISPSTTLTTLLTSTDTASTSPTATEINETRSVYYGVNTGNSTMSGAYSMANNGAIVYTLTMDTSCANYTFRYNANNGKADEESSPYTQELGLNSKETLKRNTFTAPAKNQSTGKLYTFKGWNTKSDGTGTMYKDKAEVKLDAGDTLPTNDGTITVGSNVVVDLYAIWWTPTLADLTQDWGTMQDMSPEACYNSTAYNKDTSSPANTPYNASTNPNGYHTITLSDSRGKVITNDPNTTETPETYTVTKLPDGLCWMTQNLNLGRENPDGPNGNGTITLTSDDTDIPEDITNPNNPTVTTFTLPTSTTAFATTNNDASYVTPKVYMGGSTYKGYYSFAAAIASTTAYSTSGQIITTSICPKNWDLPSSSQYDNLRTKAGYTNYTGASAAPYNFTYGGYKNGTSDLNNPTNSIRLWTATNYNSSYAYYTTAYGTATYSSNYKRYGESIRCVADNGKVTINYNANDSNEYPATSSIPIQESVDINGVKTPDETIIYRTGFMLSGWNTAADGSGTSIAAGVALSNLNPEPGSTITLYAQWIPQYTITYINNCLTYVSGNSSCTQSTSNSASTQGIELNASGNGSGTLAAYNQWTLTGWKIKGWSTVANNSDNSNTEYKVSTTYSVTNANPEDSITLYAHWMPLYSIQYDGNGADNVNGMGTTNATTGLKSLRHTNIIEGDSVQLLPSNFKRDGYGFAGWSTDADAVIHSNDNDASNDPKIYGPMETIEAPAYPTSGTNIMTLYAVWIRSVGSMQTDITTVCNGLTIDPNNGTAGLSTVSALTDDRDGSTYAIAKLADNKCWMIENLRLADKDSNNNDIILTSQNTHNPSLPLNNSWYYENRQGTLTTSNHLSATSDPTSTNPDTAWCQTTSSDCDDQSMLATNNTTLYTSNTATLISTYASGNVYSYGNYYNWYSATAGHGKYGNDYGSGYNAPGDICPVGWHLPTGTYTGEFYALNTAVNSGATDSTANNKLRSYPNSFVYSGYVNGSSVDARNSYGYYWSASGSDANYAYHMRLYSGSVGPGAYVIGSKYYGRMVRCVSGV